MVSRTLTPTQTNTGMPAIAAAGLRNPLTSEGLTPVSVPVQFIPCDQVGRKPAICPDGQVILPWGWGAQKPLPGFSHAEIKAILADSLRGCGRERDADAVSRCGEDFKIGQCGDCNTFVGFPVSCDNRLCPDCAARRAERLISEHYDMLRQIRYPKMITLTFFSVEHLDRAYFADCRKKFKKLRHRKVFEHVIGGIYSFEVTYTLGVGWHVHIHALVESSWIEQAELSREWEEITGARVVDIRAVYGKDKWAGVREVVKYPSKISTFINNPALVDEFLRATKGVNLAYGFGALYRVRTRKHGGGEMVCPVCGGVNIDFAHGAGFIVAKDRVKRMRGGYVLRPPPRAVFDE